MAVRLGSQYDKRAFLGAKFKHGWKKLTRPEENKADVERVARIEALAEPFSTLTQQELQDWVEHWRSLARAGELHIPDMVEEAFAVVREASRRTTGLFHYPEQLIGGLILVRGAVAEMATGEGKTLAISLPAFVFSLFGRGVHCVTVNSYLAERDCEFSTQIFDYLGVTVRHLPEGKAGTPDAKREAYAADITYGVGYEFGFDYLRDQLILLRSPKTGPRERLRNALLGRETPQPGTVQRELAYAIIDEVDSVLIDEAGSPLVISESAPGRNEGEAAYHAARDLAGTLRDAEHYEMDLSRRGVKLTREGFEHIHRETWIPWHLLKRPWQSYILNALRAEHFFLRDAHYVIDDENKVVIIDEFTGRRFTERTWRDGLHQAVEAKEGVEIRAENDSAATITRQRYFALYEEMCGLTGTAAESAGEFSHFFDMGVETIPLHKPSRRKMLPERVFQSAAATRRAVLLNVMERQRRGQPVLVGTRTIRASEALAELFTQAGVPFTLLTAKQDAEESAIVARAGLSGHILIATNMAGRGTHIDLEPESLAAGGLHVIAVERNESVRIDRQLIGRGARQGQPGSGQVFVSADDHLIEHYAADLGEKIRRAKASPEGEVSGRFSAAIDQLQQSVERLRYEQRLALAQRDKWLDEIKSNLA